MILQLKPLQSVCCTCLYQQQDKSNKSCSCCKEWLKRDQQFTLIKIFIQQHWLSVINLYVCWKCFYLSMCVDTLFTTHQNCEVHWTVLEDCVILPKIQYFIFATLRHFWRFLRYSSYAKNSNIIIMNVKTQDEIQQLCWFL